MCRKPDHYLWKLDRTENFSRMRMRLARNYNFNRHEDASNLRDTGLTVAETPSKDTAAKELLAKVTKRSSTSWEEEEVLFEQLWSDANSTAIREEGEESGGVAADSKERKLIKEAECHLIMLMDNIAGHLEITSKHLYFLSDQGEKNQSQTCEFLFRMAELRVICMSVCLSSLSQGTAQISRFLWLTCVRSTPDGTTCPELLLRYF